MTDGRYGNPTSNDVGILFRCLLLPSVLRRTLTFHAKVKSGVDALSALILTTVHSIILLMAIHTGVRRAKGFV